MPPPPDRLVQALHVPAGAAIGPDVVSRGAPQWVAWCQGCRSAHGFGWCGHAMRLTHEHIVRAGARFNWR